MYLFIAIILIAELIIATNIICLIKRADKAVLALDEKLCLSRPEICSSLKAFKEGVEKFVLGVHAIVEFSKRQRQKYLITIAQNVLIYLLLYMLRGKKKKYAPALRMAMALKDYWACNS
ncbi:MAG: hypothetical protein E7Z93_06800 [Cyanobacteria bacterium SIG32]|nr:hypothetical protein [Cyanobacteria bacterium SIG32]